MRQRPRVINTKYFPTNTRFQVQLVEKPFELQYLQAELSYFSLAIQ